MDQEKQETKKVEIHYHIHPEITRGYPRNVRVPKKTMLTALNGSQPKQDFEGYDEREMFQDKDENLVPDIMETKKKKDLIYQKALKSIYREEQG